MRRARFRLFRLGTNIHRPSVALLGRALSLLVKDGELTNQTSGRRSPTSRAVRRPSVYGCAPLPRDASASMTLLASARVSASTPPAVPCRTLAEGFTSVNLWIIPACHNRSSFSRFRWADMHWAEVFPIHACRPFRFVNRRSGVQVPEVAPQNRSGFGCPHQKPVHRRILEDSPTVM